MKESIVNPGLFFEKHKKVNDGVEKEIPSEKIHVVLLFGWILSSLSKTR